MSKLNNVSPYIKGFIDGQQAETGSCPIVHDAMSDDYLNDYVAGWFDGYLSVTVDAEYRAM